MKRFFDLVAAILLLIMLFPVMALSALAVRISMGPPVLYRQLRPGLHARPFYIYKFRTMKEAGNNTDSMLSDASRITPLGRRLRRYSIDELPQLFNVIRGELSLVGPRPLLMEYLPLYSAEQARRHTVRPGITGWAQVRGRNALTWEEKFSLDLWYVDNHTLWLDLKILILTVWKVLRAEGVNRDREETMPRFGGNRD